MIIHPNFIFAHIPRCGGNFVYKFLLDNYPKDCKKTRKIHKSISEMNTKGKCSFSIVRNVFEWYVSFWYKTRIGSRHGAFDNMYRDKSRRDNFDKFLYYIMERDKDAFGYIIDFEIMNRLNIGLLTYDILNIVTNKIKTLNLSPEDITSDNIKNEILVDYFINYDEYNFKRNLCKFFDDAKILDFTEDKRNNLLNMKKVNNTKHDPYQRYYTKDMIEMIKQKDSLIFELFGFKFEDEKMNVGVFSYSGNDIKGKRKKKWVSENIVGTSFFKSSISNKKDILDVGSGNGRMNEYINSYNPKCNITNIEPSVALDDIYNYKNVKYIKTTFEDYCKSNNYKGKYDLITFFLSFYIMDNKEKTIRECINLSQRGKVNIFILENIDEVTNPKRFGYYNVEYLFELCNKLGLELSVQSVNVEPRSIMFYIRG